MARNIQYFSSNERAIMIAGQIHEAQIANRAEAVLIVPCSVVEDVDLDTGETLCRDVAPGAKSLEETRIADDDDLRDALRRRELFYEVFHDRPSPDLEKGFGKVSGEGIETRGKPRAKRDGDHGSGTGSVSPAGTSDQSISDPRKL